MRPRSPRCAPSSAEARRRSTWRMSSSSARPRCAGASTPAPELRGADCEPPSSYDQRVSDLKVATAAVENAKAAIRSAELNVEFTRITAPITGRISRHQVSIGNLISGGESGSAGLLTTIVSLDPIYFYFDMSEADHLAYERATARGRMRSTRDSSVGVSLHLSDEKGWPHEIGRGT